MTLAEARSGLRTLDTPGGVDLSAMYYPSLFSALRQYEVPVVTSSCRGERGEIPLDLSNKNNVRQSADPSTGSDTEAAELLMLEHRKLAAGLSTQSLQGMARHLPPSSVSSFFDPALFRLPTFRTDANGLCGHSTPTMVPPLGGTSPFCLDRVPVSTVTTPTYGTHALTTLLQQRERCLDQANNLCAANARNPSQPIFFDPLPLHLRANGQRERSLFAPTLAAPLGIPGYPIYPDLLSDVGRTEKGAFTSLRSPTAADKAFYLNGGLEAARFAEHLQRLREQHAHQAKCSGTCCSTITCGCCIQGSSQSPLCAARGGVGCLANKDPATTGKMCNTTCDLLPPGLSLLGARPNPADLRFINPYCHTLGDGLQRDDSVTGLFQPSPLWGALPTMPLAKGPVPLTTSSPFTAPKKKDSITVQKENGKPISKELTDKDKEGSTLSERWEEKVRCHPVTSTHKSEHDIIVIEETANPRNQSVIREASVKTQTKPKTQICEDNHPPNKMPRLEAVVSESSVINSSAVSKSATPLSPPPLIAVSSSGPTVTTSHLPITPTALIAQPQYHNVYSAQHLVNKMSLVASVNSPKLADQLPHYYNEKTIEDIKPDILPFSMSQVVRHYENSDPSIEINRTVLQNLLTDSNIIKHEYQQCTVVNNSPSASPKQGRLSPKNGMLSDTENVEQQTKPITEKQLIIPQRTKSLHHQPGNVSAATKLAKSLRQKSRRLLGLRTDFKTTAVYRLLSRKYKHFGYWERLRKNRRFAVFRTRWTLRKQVIYRPDAEDVHDGKKDPECRPQTNLGIPWRERLVYSCHRRTKTGLDMVARKKRKSRPQTKPWHKERTFPKVISEPPTSMPPEMKRMMVNKALGETILHRAARLGYTDVVTYCLDSNYGDVNARDNAGYTPLHECCARGHLEIGRALLRYGADVNASAAGGIRPLHDAIENGHVQLVRLVLSYGADPIVATYSGLTPLKLARSAMMAEMLQGFLADISGETNGRPLLPWRFHGSASCLDPEGTGFDIFEDVPPDTDSDVEGNTDFLFEVSATPHLPAYRLQLPATLIKPRCNWLKLSDVLRQTSLRRKEFCKLYGHIDIVAVPYRYFQANAVCSQLLNGKRNNITEDRVEDGSLIELVKLDNNIRDILGIETITLR